MYPQRHRPINICYTKRLDYKDASAHTVFREECNTVTYRVYQSDIDGGLKFDPQYNPVARAIRRRHPTKNVRIDLYDVCIGEQRIKLPLRVRLWLHSHDFGCNVRPIRFELIVPTR